MIFPKNSRTIAAKAAVGVLLMAGMATGAVWYYGTPKYSRVGYEPTQPIPFSHKIHVGQVGLDCRHCHTNVTESPHANLPATETCWTCHGQDKGAIKHDSPLLAPLVEAKKTGRPIDWVRVHKVPDYAFFNHAVHVNRGVACASCHGQVNEMAVVRHEKPLSMAWCLECHRAPEANLRPGGQVTNMAWDWRTDPTLKGKTPEEFGRIEMAHSKIEAPVSCTGCHR